MTKFGNVLVRFSALAFMFAMVVISIGRADGVWEGDPLVPLLMFVLVSTNSAIYQIVMANLGGIISINQKLEVPPPTITEQIERQAEQN